MLSIGVTALLVFCCCPAGVPQAHRADLSPAPSLQADEYGAQTSIEAAFATYLRVLEQRVKDTELGVYSSETQRLLRGRRVTDGQQRLELQAIQAVYSGRVTSERADLAVVRFPGDPRVPPYFFRRQPAGWTIDLAAASRAIGFDRSGRWYVRDPTSEFAFGF